MYQVIYLPQDAHFSFGAFLVVLALLLFIEKWVGLWWDKEDFREYMKKLKDKK